MNTYTGKIVKFIFGKNTKSEHEALGLELENGSIIKLRRIDGNPFHDQKLIEMLDQEISCEGTMKDGILFLKI